MIRVKILKNGIEVQRAIFDSEQKKSAWLKLLETDHAWGLPGEYDAVVENIEQELEQEKINQEALAYLASTDWYVIRELDTGEVCPLDIEQKRIQARAKIVR